MNKQIEEMAQDIYEQKSCDTSFKENCKILAYDLVTLGYQKIDKDSAVLSREEQEKILTATEKRIKELKRQILQARKETAEKILKEQYQECKIAEQDVLKARGGNKNDDYYKGFSLGITNTKMHIQELAKQFGVEIKENNNER